MRLLQEVSSSVIKNTYKVFTKLLFNNDASKGEAVMTKDGKPVKTMSGQEQTVNQFCERMLVEALFRTGTTENVDRRFEPGAARIAITECGWNPLIDNNENLDPVKLGRFKIILEYITRNFNNREKITNDLNGETYQSLYDTLSPRIKEEAEKEDAELRNLQNIKSDHEYKIIRIDSFRESRLYYNYTNPNSRWCLTYSITNYNGYTANGKNTMYFCLRDDIDTVKYEIGPNCPLDDYGKSMLCIIVNPDGRLSTFTTRWNHTDANGNRVAADHGVGDKKTISQIVGVNFNDVFKPYDGPKKEFKVERKNNDFEIGTLMHDDSQFIDSVHDNLIQLYNELQSLYDEDNSSFDDPEDLTWQEMMDIRDWDMGAIFTPDVLENLNEENTSAFGNTLLLVTNTGYYKLVCPEQPDNISTDWCDDIIAVSIGGSDKRYGIFAIKEHNVDYYKLISVDTYNNDLRDLEINFENKISKIHSISIYDTTDYFVTFSNNTHGLIHISDNFRKITLETTEIDLPDEFINNIENVEKIAGSSEDKNLFFKVRNPETRKHNLIYQKHNFKLELKPEDEFEYTENSNEIRKIVKFSDSKDVTKLNMPLIVSFGSLSGKKAAIDLKTFTYLFNKKGCIVETGNPEVFTYIADVETSKELEDIHHGNIELYTFDYRNKNLIHKTINDVYFNENVIRNIARSKYNFRFIGAAYTNKERTMIIVFDVNGNILYKSKEPEISLDEKHDVYLSCNYSDEIAVLDDRHLYGKKLKLIKADEINKITNESFILKYAAYLLG